MSGTRPDFQTPPLKPVPRPRSHSTHARFENFSRNAWHKEKEKLVDLFRESSQVDHKHIAMAQMCIKHSQGECWYQYVPLDSILERNKVKEKPDQLMMMASVFDNLITYAVNLLKPNRHPHWRSITTNKQTFRTRINCMEGARGILKEIGYSVETNISLQFPEHELEPNKPKLCVLAAELLMCKMEVKEIDTSSQMVSSRHRLAGAKVADGTRQVFPRRALSKEEFFDAHSQFPGSSRLLGSDNWPLSSGRQPTDVIAQHGFVGSYTRDIDSPSQSTGGRPPLREVDNASPRILRAGLVDDESTAQRRIESTSPMSRDDRLNQLSGGEGSARSLHQHKHTIGLHSTPLSENMSPPERNIGTPALRAYTPTENTRFPADSRRHPGGNITSPLGNVRLPVENIGTPDLSTGSCTEFSRFPIDSRGGPGESQTPHVRSRKPLTENLKLSLDCNRPLAEISSPPVATRRHAENTDSTLRKMPTPVPRARNRNLPHTVLVSSVSLPISLATNMPCPLTSSECACLPGSTNRHKSLPLQEATALPGTTSDCFDASDHISAKSPSAGSVDLELVSGTGTHPNPTSSSNLNPTSSSFDDLRKGLDNLRNRSRVEVSRAETSESVLVRSSHTGRGEYALPRKTKTESFPTKAGAGNTGTSILTSESKTPLLKHSSAQSFFSSVKVPPKAKRQHVCFGNDPILEEMESDKDKTTLGGKHTSTETRKTPSSEQIDEQHTHAAVDCHPVLIGMAADVAVKPSLSPPPGPLPNVRSVTMPMIHKYSCPHCNKTIPKDNYFCGKCGEPVQDNNPDSHRLGVGGEIGGAYPGHIMPPSGKIGDTAAPVVRASAKETEKVEKRHWTRELQRKEEEEVEQPEEKQREDKRKVEDGGMGRREGDGGRGGGGGGGTDEQRRIPGDEDGKPAGSDSNTGINTLGEKAYVMERRSREFQERKGRKESEIESHPSNGAIFKSSTPSSSTYSLSPAKKRSQQDRAVEQHKKLHSRVAKTKDEKEDKVSRKMATLGAAGQRLLDCIKECMPYGFTLEEIQLACHCSLDQPVLHYLNTTWAKKVRTLRQLVNVQTNKAGKRVGLMTEKKAKQVLLETGGDMAVAAKRIFQEREEKIKQLLNKMNNLKQLEPKLPELEWDMAVKALSQNGMDVKDTFYMLQTEWLQPLYDYIFSEFTDVAKTDMENIKRMIKSENEDQYPPEARIRLLMAEFKFEKEKQAKIALGLIEKVEVDGAEYPLNYYVDAAHDFDSIETALEFLNKECPMCTGLYPIHEMITFPNCTDFMCRSCFIESFTIIIKEKEVKHFSCPTCCMPDMANREATNDHYLEILVAMVNENLSSDLYELMQKKLTEFSLMRQPGFVWCANCPSGFIFDVGVARVPRKIKCPQCKNQMCHKCKKPWEEQHDGVSCEGFAQWKQNNDPDLQKQGLAAHLKANGIECPQCHMRYDLARGGCLHFRCTRCPNEFCSGCGQSFKNGVQCGRLKSCGTKGLHAHHPRDCLFYLRDFDVDELQEFLRNNNVKFDVKPPREQVDEARKKREKQGVVAGEGGVADGGVVAGEGGVAAGEGGVVAGEGGVVVDNVAHPEGGAAAEANDDEEVELKCRVMLQKELPEGLRDEECGREVIVGHAGLCVLHYKEYLVDKINKNHLDPVTIYPTEKIELMLIREELEVPEHNDDAEDAENEEDYDERLIQHVKQRLPLIKHEEG